MISNDGTGTGMLVNNSTNVKIYGLRIKNNNYGIQLSGVSTNNTILANSIESNESIGIFISSIGADNNTILKIMVYTSIQAVQIILEIIIYMIIHIPVFI